MQLEDGRTEWMMHREKQITMIDDLMNGMENTRMDSKNLMKEMVDFNKMAFDNLFNAMNILQDQMEKIVSMYPEKAPWFPEEGKKLITDWVKAYTIRRAGTISRPL
jgi:hypothetical protein